MINAQWSLQSVTQFKKIPLSSVECTHMKVFSGLQL